MNHQISLQNRVIGKIILAFLIEIFLCVLMILGLTHPAFKNDLPDINFDTYIGAIVSIVFLYTVIYLIFQYIKIAPKGKITVGIVFVFLVIGYVGYSLCFAFVYFLHGGLDCPNTLYEGHNFTDSFWYSISLTLISPPDDFCGPNKSNIYVPVIQKLAIIVIALIITIIELLEVKEVFKIGKSQKNSE